MTHVISVLNMKGGVGKTTTTVMLGEFLAAESGKKVLLVDMDPQVSLSITMLGERQWKLVKDGDHTLAALFREALDTARVGGFDIARAVYPNASNVKNVTDVDLLPLSPEVMDLQPHLDALSVAKRSSVKVWDILALGLEPILDDYDYVLIDCPPSLDVMTKNALRASDGYVVPTIPDVLSTYGIPLLQEKVTSFAAQAGIEAPEELGVIVTKHQKISPTHRQQIARLRSNRSLPPLLAPWVPETSKISGAAEFQEYPTLKTKYGATNYKGLWELTEAFRQRVEDGE
ncbi:chromosome partitioning protein [Raineyella antarctica]|uniref:Chromosome partitioning protein n=1 Tax=Raineyella antarctica TaxID=1577474 RepID=A0A1G6GIA1_9ACTN|nr:ParA family protein [Raineyella antarctica]SDB81475.1 chromosome partitioning protein [Raineyella antarctica]